MIAKIVCMNEQATPVVYIASPYSQGDRHLNTHFQCDVFDRFLMGGVVTPIAPLWSHFQHCIHPRPYADWLAYDLKILERCDALIRLNAHLPHLGYKQAESNGADNEVIEAKRLGKPVFYDVISLYSWARSYS